MRLLLPALLLLGVAVSVSAQQSSSVSQDLISGDAMPAALSEFGFFTGSASKPSSQLIPYSLGTPLFSDYAEKQRFIYLPMGTSVRVEEASGKLTFPVGTAIIKSFGYDNGSGELKILETRVMLHRADGWTALPYVWRADGSDADLKLGGKRIPVTFNRPDGESQTISYAVPNKNQCKQCHSSKDQLEPIGPILGNMEFPDMAAKGRLLKDSGYNGAPVMAFAKWDKPAAASVNDRAASYLFVNCAHCHRPSGSASNSGLFLDRGAHDGASMGINKRPVAAGRGSGGFDFVIAPGQPERSILLHRMNSLEADVAMPELGRAAVHAEGLALLNEWVAEMPGK
jgi:uncharacterized repeat protein (TIGR03806 family)